MVSTVQCIPVQIDLQSSVDKIRIASIECKLIAMIAVYGGSKLWWACNVQGDRSKTGEGVVQP